MRKFKVFITRKIAKAGIETFPKDKYEIETWNKSYPPTKLDIINSAKDSDALLTMVSDKITSELIDCLPTLKIISNNAVGYDNIDIEHAFQKNITVTNTPNTLTESVSELTVALLMTYTKNILSFVDWTRDGNWKTWEPTFNLGVELKNKTLGIIGMGEIGLNVAKICHTLGMSIIYHSRSNNNKANSLFSISNTPLSEVLSRSDFVSIHTDLNSTTKQLFNYSNFLKMKKSAVFINTSRGEIHCQKDLIKALNQEQIAGAILDVSSPEPIEANSPLLNMQNVLITPHIGSATIEARNRMAQLAAENIICALAGKSQNRIVPSS